MDVKKEVARLLDSSQEVTTEHLQTIVLFGSKHGTNSDSQKTILELAYQASMQAVSPPEPDMDLVIKACYLYMASGWPTIRIEIPSTIKKLPNALRFEWIPQIRAMAAAQFSATEQRVLRLAWRTEGVIRALT